MDSYFSGCDDYPCLIFNDEFDTLNFETWEHELTAGGGGVGLHFPNRWRSSKYVVHYSAAMMMTLKHVSIHNNNTTEA